MSEVLEEGLVRGPVIRLFASAKFTHQRKKKLLFCYKEIFLQCGRLH